MFSVEMLSKEKAILGLAWRGFVSAKEVLHADEALEQLQRQLGKPFDLLVDLTGALVFSQETQKALVEHQRKLIVLGMKRAAVAVGEKAITKLQLHRTAKESAHNNEFQFATVSEAKQFLGF